MMQLAKEYLARAAELAGGQLPEVGEVPAPVAPGFNQPGVQQQQQPQSARNAPEE
jgi:hypothetical protein